MADNNWDQFEFNETVTGILTEGQEGWIDILSWDFKSNWIDIIPWEVQEAWIDILSWDFQINQEGQVAFKDVVVAEVDSGMTDEVWLASLLVNLNEEGFF
ncbi:hypothetical protein [Litoreibacter janthinus]|uniref:Uncharacterized protein n=1 Tax=Litoreibacter janthinus TaxID=670154 RepID=A0A1I6G4Q1_9RHOB|nr:hypothetical protein [Litoreibacter janthinus]SFR37169.1 hypothetical protein SAMN04488002_0896 [Litoreibacter janthinus]